MKTKLWHIGIASAIMGSMGLAQAQTSPSYGDVNPSQSISPTPSGPASDGLKDPTNVNSRPNWDTPQSMDQAPVDPSLSNVPPSDSLAGVDERRNQGVLSNDGMNIPPAFNPGSLDPDPGSQ